MISTKVVFPKRGEVKIVKQRLRPLKAGEVLISTRVSIISAGTELAWLRGPAWLGAGGQRLPIYPDYPGSCNAGVVIKTGSGANRFGVGDYVASNGAHASHVIVRQDGLIWPKPPNVTLLESAFATLGAVALNAVELGNPQAGECVGVIGLGLVGQLVCKLAGLRTTDIMVVDHNFLRIKKAVENTPHSSVARLYESCLLASNPETWKTHAQSGVDIVFEASGRAESYNSAFVMANRGGRIIALGTPRQPGKINIAEMHAKALVLINSAGRGGETGFKARGQCFLELLKTQNITVSDLITHTFDGNSAKDAYRHAEKRKGDTLGVLLNWNR